MDGILSKDNDLKSMARKAKKAATDNVKNLGKFLSNFKYFKFKT